MRARIAPRLFLLVAMALAAPLAAVAQQGEGGRIAAGSFHVCALTTVGGVVCWGRNDSGQLGNGTNTLSPLPVPVIGLASGIQVLALGQSHSCALTTGGGVLCWGNNAQGQLGDGTTSPSSVPVAVTGLASGVTAIAAGGSHSCALTTGGGVQCWGSNTRGQLGDGSTTPSSVPVAVTGLASGGAAIAAGSSHSCALTTGGGVQCWGYNEAGQLGGGTFTLQSVVPVAVTGLASGVAAISAGGIHSCALTTGGGVLCWGANAVGQLGNGAAPADSSVPVQVSGLTSGIAAIAAGGNSTCALATGGGVLCWGAYGPSIYSFVPVPVADWSSGVAVIAPGDFFTCALTTGGAECLGNNDLGQLGQGTAGASSAPVQVIGLGSGIAATTAGSGNSCALTTGGGVLCWGLNVYGQLGIGTSGLASSNVPVPVTGLSSGMAAITAGTSHICALSAGGGVLCWGANFNGQLGNGGTAQSNLPVAVTGLSSGVALIAAGSHQTCALTTGGGVQCWGQNNAGQLGNGSTSNSSLPVPVTGLSSGGAAIAAGSSHTCALTTGGGVQCWGRNFEGQLGNGSTANSSVPVAVTGLASGVAAITAGTLHTCAVTTGGGVLCWGRNDQGQLGDGTTANSSLPVSVPSLASGVAAVVAGLSYTCALTTGGGVLCWGSNSAGMLGDGSFVSSVAPVSVIGLAGGASAIDAGSAHNCAVNTGGGLQCWGQNDGAGKLGDGHVSRSETPLPVMGFALAAIPVPALGAPGLALLAALLAAAAHARARREAR